VNLKKSAFFVVLLAVVCIDQQVFAQKTIPANAAPVFVPLPDDIHCSLHNLMSDYSFGENRLQGKTLVSVKKVTCQITGNSPGQEKEIPLASTEITLGMLPTKDFGALKLSTENRMDSGVTTSIRRDKLQSFRAFLEKQ
jgi:hypothetical protein